MSETTAWRRHDELGGYTVLDAFRYVRTDPNSRLTRGSARLLETVAKLLEVDANALEERVRAVTAERDEHQRERQRLAIQALQDLDEKEQLSAQLTASESARQAEFIKANVNHEKAVAYRLCVEEAGSNQFHLREWIQENKSARQAAEATVARQEVWMRLTSDLHEISDREKHLADCLVIAEHGWSAESDLRQAAEGRAAQLEAALKQQEWAFEKRRQADGNLGDAADRQYFYSAARQEQAKADKLREAALSSPVPAMPTGRQARDGEAEE